MSDAKVPPWMQWEPGQRVVLRYRADDGVHDALGTLLSTGPHGVEIETKRGPVQVPASRMIIGKRVPPPPVR